jgi:hypothetical protein
MKAEGVSLEDAKQLLREYYRSKGAIGDSYLPKVGMLTKLYSEG